MPNSKVHITGKVLNCLFTSAEKGNKNMHTNIRNHTVTKNNMNSMTSSWFYRFINERSEFITVVIPLPSVLWHCWLGVRKNIWPEKNWAMRCWCGYLSGSRCRLFAYGPADATAIWTPHHLLPYLNPDWFYLSGTTVISVPTTLTLTSYFLFSLASKSIKCNLRDCC